MRPATWSVTEEAQLLVGTAAPNLHKSSKTLKIDTCDSGTDITIGTPQTSSKTMSTLTAYYKELASKISRDDPEPANDLSTFHAVGIVVSMEDPRSGDSGDAPWEIQMFDFSSAQSIGTVVAGQDGEKRDSCGNPIVSAYTKRITRFTGLHPGCIVSICGEVIRMDAGRPSSILVNSIATPAPPIFPWTPLPVGSELPVEYAVGESLRIHFVSGPFPPEDVAGIVSSVVITAVARCADLLIIGGPLVPEVTGAALAHADSYFDELFKLDSIIHETLERGKNINTRVVLVPATEDANATPVLPQGPLPLADSASILLPGNPCQLLINGQIRIGVCCHDVVSMMRDVVVDRGVPIEGSLGRVVDSIIASRLYVPVVERPSPIIDLVHLDKLRMIAEPAGKEKCIAPHLVFFPSVKPRFALRTMGGSGPLAINNGLHNPRQKNVPFAVHGVEVTIPHLDAVVAYGASAETGVTVGVLNFDKRGT